MYYEQEIKTVLSDADKNLNITNRAILHFFENIATNHSNALGCGVDDTYTKGITWIILDWSIKIVKRPKYREKLLLRTWASGTEKFFTYRDFELLNGNGEICAIGTARFVIRDIKEQKMIIMSEELSNRYKPEERRVIPEEKFAKIRVPTEFSNKISYTVMRRDIDFNRHMHNLYHFDLAYETLPNDVFENSELNNFRISYKKEIKLGETVKCQYAFDGEKHFVYISNSDGNMNSIICLW